MSSQRKEHFLPKLSVRRPVTVMMMFIALVVLGFIAYTKIPLEMMPSGYEAPFMGVRVPYSNATPEIIQNRIVRPIEEILGTVRNVQETGAMIRYDFAWIRVSFAQGTDMDLAYAEVRDRMDRVMADMPDDLERIYVRRFDMNDDAEITIPLTINKDVPDLFYFLEHHLGRHILRLDGVANVEFEGVQEKQFEVILSADRLSQHRINLFETAQLIRQNSFALPSGHVQEGDRRFYVRSDGRFKSVEDLRSIEIRPGILLSDIAEITYHVPERNSITRVDSQPGVWLSIRKESGANMVEVHHAVVGALEEQFKNNANLQGVQRGPIFSQGQLIIDSIADLQETAIYAGIFAIFVLFFFLRHLRMTMVITMAIPISLLITIVIMNFTGETLNLLSLMGLMISVGLVVDNSVVVLENIFRHRRAGDGRKKAAIRGAGEVALAVVMATLTTVVVFLPMILMGRGSMLGFFMERIGLPVVFSLFSSLFVALVFIPLVTTLFKDGKGKMGQSNVIEWFRDRYRQMLGWALKHRVETAVVAIFGLIMIFVFAGDVGFQGEDRHDNNTTLRFRLPRKYSNLEEFPMVLARKVEEFAEQNKDFLDFDVLASRVNDDYVRISLMRTTERSDTPLLQKPVLWVRNMFGLESIQSNPENERRQFLKDNLHEAIGILPSQAPLSFGWGDSGTERSQIQLALIGPDYDELRNWGERVQEELRRLPGILDVDTDDEAGNDELHVVIDRERARAAGVNVRVASFTISNAMRGAQLPKFQEEDREIDVLMRLKEADRVNVASLKNLKIPSESGREIPLSAIASFENTKGPNSISHTNQRPSYTLTITGESPRVDMLYGLVSGAMKTLGNGQGYDWSFGSGRSRMRDDQTNFIFAALLAVVFVFLLMGVLFESFALPLTIIATVPFAFAGSQLLLKLYNMPANLFAYIGIIIIVGVVVNNGIVLVDLINRLRAEGKKRFEAIIEAAYYRFRPILMTAFTTIFSLVPMAFGDASLVGLPYNPLGMAMIGGLALNSLLSLFLVPVFYTFFDDLKRIWVWGIGIMAGRKKGVAGARAAANK